MAMGSSQYCVLTINKTSINLPNVGMVSVPISVSMQFYNDNIKSENIIDNGKKVVELMLPEINRIDSPVSGEGAQAGRNIALEITLPPASRILSTDNDITGRDNDTEITGKTLLEISPDRMINPGFLIPYLVIKEAEVSPAEE